MIVSQPVFLKLSRKIWLVLLVGYWICLTIATHYPKLNAPEIPGSDKTAHVLVYLGLMLFWSGWAMTYPITIKNLIKGWLIVLAAGAMDEITQPMFQRFADFNDWLADGAGATVGVTIAMLVLSSRNSPASNEAKLDSQ
jgi:VanZ family protein